MEDLDTDAGEAALAPQPLADPDEPETEQAVPEVPLAAEARSSPARRKKAPTSSSASGPPDVPDDQGLAAGAP